MNREASNQLDNDLISLAYTMAVEPQRLEQMMELLDTRLKHHLDTDFTDNLPPESADDLEDHFERAMSLLDRYGRNNAQAKSSMKFMEFDYQPSATICMDGTFEYANNSAFSCLGWKKGEQIKRAAFETGEFARFSDGLKQLETAPHGQFIGLYTLTNQADTDATLQIALSTSVNKLGETIGRLSTIHLKIAPEIAQEFKTSLGLTQTEFAITQAIVAGQSVADIAATRNRSPATVRTQLKSLLSKLGLRSQVELACFYSGFAQFSVQRQHKSQLATLETDIIRKTALFPRPDGRQISYDVVGPASGRPVIYFHALGCGTGVTQDVYKELIQRNLKLIMPWRPHFDDTTPVKPFKKTPHVFAEDILALMDALKIRTCSFLTNVSGTIWAYVAAAHCGSRVTHITVTAGAVPLSNAQLKMIDFRQRISIQIARHAPKLLPFAMRAAVAKIDAGFDQELMLEHYQSSPLDQDFIKSEEMKHINQVSHARTIKQGHTPLVQELYLMARKWDHWMHRVTCPVTILQGQHDPSFPPEIVETSIRNRSNFTLKIIPDAAQLLLFQKPDIVFKTVEQGIPD